MWETSLSFTEHALGPPFTVFPGTKGGANYSQTPISWRGRGRNLLTSLTLQYTLSLWSEFLLMTYFIPGECQYCCNYDVIYLSLPRFDEFIDVTWLIYWWCFRGDYTTQLTVSSIWYWCTINDKTTRVCLLQMWCFLCEFRSASRIHDNAESSVTTKESALNLYF